MPNSPLLYGPNGTATNLQSQILQSNGSLLQNNGPRNYINYNNFENQATTGWSLGTTGTLTNGIPTGTPTFGSGAAGTLSLAASTSSPIAGTASLSLVSSAATTAGNMFASDLLPIDTADQAKVLTYTFYYTVPTGVTNANFSGTSSNSYGIACYDVTNSSWLPVVGNFAMTQNSGVGIATGTMQTNVTTANVRFIVYCVNATAGAVTVNFDRFYLGPQTAPIGAVMTDWQSYTPTFTGFGTPSAVAAEWRRVGDAIEIRGTFTSGSSTGVEARMTLPTGLTTADTTKLPTIRPAGIVAAAFAQASAFMILMEPSVGYVTFGNQDSTHAGITKLNGSAFLGLGNQVYFNSLPIPISGYSSQVQMSSDTDTRVLAASYYVSASYSCTGGTTINFDTKRFDTYSAVVAPAAGAGTWKFVAPVTGLYQVEVNLAMSTNSTFVYMRKNGVSYIPLLAFTPPTSSALANGTGMVDMVAGDYIDIINNSTQVIQGAAPTTAGNSFSCISIFRLSGPAVIAATETVAASYTTANTTVLFAGSNSTQIPFTAKVLDTHSAYNTSTGSYVLPATGTYSVQVNTYAAPTTGNWALVIYQNSTQVGYGTIGNGIQSQAFATVNGLAGDVISIRGNANSGSGNCTFGLSSTSRDQLSITRIK